MQFTKSNTPVCILQINLLNVLTIDYRPKCDDVFFLTCIFLHYLVIKMCEMLFPSYTELLVKMKEQQTERKRSENQMMKTEQQNIKGAVV